MGRAEIKSDGVWGTICDAEFDVLEGNVICRRLGYGTVKTISGQAGYGRGVGKIHLTELKLVTACIYICSYYSSLVLSQMLLYVHILCCVGHIAPYNTSLTVFTL